jgi:hypothetical protein
MPRKAPDKVIEHRISLSNFERTQILEQIEKNRENSLIKSGINQIGGIAGSGVLLYAVGAYFGIGIFSSAYDAVSDFVNNTSSSLADFLNPAGVGNYSDEEAFRVTNAFNVLDVGIKEHRDLERANAAALNGLVARLQSGEITYAEFMPEYRMLKDESATLDILRMDLINARNVVTYIRNEFNYDRGSIPSWFGTTSYADLIEAAKGYDSSMADTTGYTPQFVA